MTVAINSRTYLISVLLLSFATSAHAQIRLDLPAQPLSESLTAVGTLGHINVMFDPSLVDGLEAPALKAELSADDALHRLLSGTKLHEVRVDANTIRVFSEPATKRVRTSSGEEISETRESAPLGLVSTSAGSYSDLVVDEPATDESAVKANANQEPIELIVVTGTHIRGEETSSPVLEFGREYIEHSGYADAGDVLRSIPQMYAGGSSPQLVAGNAPGAGAAISGSTAPDLRGLGPGSTLTLIDGRRLPTDTASAVDISLIPLQAVERIEVVTDGASAVYGSDAVAGVVNFILRKDYEGLQTSVSVGRAPEGGGFDRRVSQLAGATWKTGGGWLVFEHETTDAVWSDQRDFTTDVARPYSLLPSGSRNSGALSVHQSFSETLSGFAEGLFTKRESEHDQTLPPTYSLPSSVTQYNATVGLRLNPSESWSATLSGSSGFQKTAFHLITGGVNFDTENLRGTTQTIEGVADGVLISTSAGDIRTAFGAGYRKDSYRDTDTSFGAVSTNSDGGRNVKYGYAELFAPVVAPGSRTGLNRLDVTASGRYERYSDFGSKTVPKLGVVYMPTERITLRGSWGRSFRAPALSDAYGVILARQFQMPDPVSPTGTSYVLANLGGNPKLEPETATSRTLSIEYRPSWLEGIRASASYYNIAYRNRIGQIANLLTALSNPVNAPYVTVRNPSAALQQQFLTSANGGFVNFSDAPYDPAIISAIVNGAPLNVAHQEIDGVDLGLDYKATLAVGTLTTILNATYLHLRQQVTPLAPEVEISGQAFSPPRKKARGGLTWSRNGWDLTGYLNYLGPETNTYNPQLASVGSWTTADAQLSFTKSLPVLSSIQASLSVQNVFDRDPPYLVFNGFKNGFHYDSLNASPLGRYVRAQIMFDW